MIKTKEDTISVLLENPDSYIEGMENSPSLSRDIYLASRKLKLKWDRPIADYAEMQRVRSKINRDFKLIDCKKERKLINDFVTSMICSGLPENSFYSNSDFGFDFKKNKFELFLDDKEFKGKILCLGTDESYDYYVVSPEFSGVKKVHHDIGDIVDIDIANIEQFAKTVMKFALIQGSLDKGHIDIRDIEGFIDRVENSELKFIINELILN